MKPSQFEDIIYCLNREWPTTASVTPGLSKGSSDTKLMSLELF